MTNRPLEGVKVLDLSRVLAGPWCTQLLADMGADVLKIERPVVGDDTRHWGPPWHQVGEEKVAAYFLSANRGKRSAAINFATPDGAELVRELARTADVMVENFKVGGLAKFGLDSASLRAMNPRLITASISGFGQSGPYAQRAGYDYILQGMSGLMAITGLPDDEPGGGPMRIGVAVVDLFTGLYTANAILAALHGRERTGEGAAIDSALFDTAISVLGNQASYFMIAGQDPPRQGNSHPNIVPYQPFDAADQPVIVAVGNDRQFARFADILEAPELRDARFTTNADRVNNREALIPLIAERMRTKPAAHWLELLEAAGVPAGPINRISQAIADPQAIFREMTGVALSGALSPVPLVKGPIRIDGQRADASLPPPALGEHSDAVLAELGLEPERIAELRVRGVVG
jgi:crotonobetainyl-CoA:carnitine CoA-transferase CaiB-like acyl-CoA transferase